MRLLQTAPALLLLAAPGFAQGSDSCSTAQAITGSGPFSFDTTGATTDGAPDSLCSFFGNDQIFNDVWFSWTAPASGPFRVSSCGIANGDTRIAVYAGGCAAAALACDDDGCPGTLLSTLTFDAMAGQSILVRVGNFSATGAAFGDFVIQPTRVTNPANGHVYELVNEQLSWTDASIAATQRLNNGAPGHLVTISDQAELDWILANLAPGRPWIGLRQNLSSPSYSEPAGGFEWVTGEPTTFLNWALGEPNNTSASGGPEDFVEMFASGEFNDAEDAHAQTTQYLVEWSTGTVGGTTFCTAVPNSTGMTGSISATGSQSVATNDLTLIASDLPNFQFGIFVVSRITTSPIPVNNGGNLCLGGVIGRFDLTSQIVSSGANGEFSIPVDLTLIPQGTTVSAVMPGDTWSFQAWHRDFTTTPPIMTSSNFTNGISITFN